MNLNPNHLLLGGALTAYRRSMMVSFAFSIIVNLLVLAGPLYMLQVFDRVLTSRSTDTLVMLTIICVTALFAMALIDMVRGRITVKLSAWLDKTLSPALFEGSVYKTLSRTGTSSTQSLRDMRSLRSFIASPQLFAFFDAPWAPFFILVMFVLHPYLGMVALGGAVVLFSLALLNEWSTRRPSAEDGGASIAAMNIADATVRNADSVSAMGMLPAMRNRWMETTARARANQALSERRTSIIVACSKFARMALQMMILGVGAWLAVGGEITAGAMIAGSILMSRALAPVEQTIGAWRMMIGARQSYQRVREHLLTQPVVPASMELPAPQGKVSASGVSFMVEGQREPVLRNISFALEPGDSMALIGPSGSGKSTLARLILGNFAPKTGHIRLDGMDVSSWAPDQLGPHCGYLPQDIELFGGTVKDNIARMGEPVAEHVVTAAQMAGCHELILSLPDGYDTQVGERGTSLSGGTRQRIGLARALYGNPSLIVLDEPNSNLDGHGEAALFGALQALKQRMATVIIIGHRQSTLDHVDKVLMINAGNVQAFGTKDEVRTQLGLPMAAQAEGNTRQPASDSTRPLPVAAAKPVAAAALSKPEPVLSQSENTEYSNESVPEQVTEAATVSIAAKDTDNHSVKQSIPVEQTQSSPAPVSVAPAKHSVSVSSVQVKPAKQEHIQPMTADLTEQSPAPVAEKVSENTRVIDEENTKESSGLVPEIPRLIDLSLPGGGNKKTQPQAANKLVEPVSKLRNVFKKIKVPAGASESHLTYDPGNVDLELTLDISSDVSTSDRAVAKGGRKQS